MAATRRRAKKNHLGPTAASPIMVRPPSPIDENQDTHHRHKKHLKRRVILHVASRRFVGSYEVEFCPTCPPHQIKESLQLFRAADTGSFSRNTFLTFRGMNRDTTVNSYDPDSPREMAQLIKLIEKRHQEGGKINLRIARKGLAMSFWVVFLVSALIIGTMGAITIAHSNQNINSCLLAILTNIFSGV